MKFYNVLVTTYDQNDDIPMQNWQHWMRKSEAEAMGIISQLMPQYDAGEYRRMMVVANEFDCTTGAWKGNLLYSVRHPVQKKVIYNQQKGLAPSKKKSAQIFLDDIPPQPAVQGNPIWAHAQAGAAQPQAPGVEPNWHAVAAHFGG
jgi:hypothetical protein